MKKAIWSSLIGITCIILLSYLAVQTVRIEAKLSEMARPSRLFCPALIESRIPHRKDWEVKLTPDHDSFFYTVSQQPLSWLGRGMQVVVFETQDQKYVVKFFQMTRLKEPAVHGFMKNLVMKETKEHKENRTSHREEIFKSSKICFEELQEETGIVYVHLNRTQNKLFGIKLIDKFGQSHRIRGDNSSFVVQKRCSFLIPTITKLMDSGQVEIAKKRVDQIFDLLVSVAKKGFVDGDDALIRNNNMGFSDDRAIYIDTGHLVRAENLDVCERMRYEFQVRLDPLQKWLNVSYPELGEYYQQRKVVLLNLLAQEKELSSKQVGSPSVSVNVNSSV
jgi:hypothetical protein